jgi:hypothetical protein
MNPPCVDFAIANGPQPDNSMNWAMTLAQWMKREGRPQATAPIQIARWLNASDSMEEMGDEEILLFCTSGYEASGPISCHDFMHCASFSLGCAGEKCPEFVRPTVPIIEGQPTARRVYLSDDPGTVGIDDDGAVKKVKSVTKKDGETAKVLEWVSDCAAYIHTETLSEEEREFIFEGHGAVDKVKVRFTMLAGDLADSKKFKAALINAFGAANRLGEMNFDIVQKITKNTIKRRRLCAPAWVDGKPMIPGVDSSDDIEFKFLDMIPANVHDGDLGKAKETLAKLLDIPGPTMILVAAILGAPLYARYFPNDRFGVALWGRSGSLKTSIARKSMCVYGEGYHDETNLLKFGQNSSTGVGQEELLAGAGILAEIVDNVKSVNPRDTVQYIATVHSVIEGRNKLRGKKDGGLRNGKNFGCTMIITGEIKPDEASTSARIFNMKWVEPKSKAEVDYVNKHVRDLPVIGYHWLKHLAQTELKLSRFDETRSEKTDVFNEKNYVNSGRLATIYVLLRVTWAALVESPFGDVFEARSKKFIKELDRCAEEQGAMVSEETEVARFVSGVTAILATQPHLIQDNEYQKPDEYGKNIYKDVIGRWVDVKGSDEKDLFLVPAPTLAALKRLGIFTQIPSEGSMTDALYQAGHLVTEEKRRKIQYRINGKRPVGWMIRGSVINPQEKKEKQQDLGKDGFVDAENDS